MGKNEASDKGCPDKTALAIQIQIQYNTNTNTIQNYNVGIFEVCIYAHFP